MYLLTKSVPWTIRSKRAYLRATHCRKFIEWYCRAYQVNADSSLNSGSLNKNLALIRQDANFFLEISLIDMESN